MPTLSTVVDASFVPPTPQCALCQGSTVCGLDSARPGSDSLARREALAQSLHTLKAFSSHCPSGQRPPALDMEPVSTA